MSTLSQPDSSFGRANPHALAAILEASETRRIIAATDIFDISGIKLWASNQPVSAALQRKLLDRQLREPLESCLVAQDGVTWSVVTTGLTNHNGKVRFLEPSSEGASYRLSYAGGTKLAPCISGLVVS